MKLTYYQIEILLRSGNATIFEVAAYNNLNALERGTQWIRKITHPELFDDIMSIAVINKKIGGE